MEKGVGLHEHEGEIKISIVTACYKSVAFLERIYASIKAQHYQNLEWITVDDCSPDQTLQKLHEIKERNEMNIRVIALPENTNAFGAVKKGISQATGRFTIILDHDDELMPGSISKLVAAWHSMAVTGERLYGVWGRCVNENNKLLGKLYTEAPLICTNGYFIHVLDCKEECLLMADTSLLQQFYVLSSNQTMKTNGSIWNKMGKEYRCIFTNEIIRKYYTNIPTSHMNQKTIHNSLSYANQEAEYLNDNDAYFYKDIFFFLKKILVYLNFSYHAGVSLSKTIRNFRHRNLKVATILVLPLLPAVLFKNRFINNRRYD